MNRGQFHNQEFAGDKKQLIHFLSPYEKKFIQKALPKIPPFISTAHLTLMTLVWSACIVASGYLAQNYSMHWLWLFSACIVMQYITDMLDGAVGRSRNTGLVKWGFYMDHFLDYVFLASILMGYYFLLPSSYAFLAILCLAFSTGFMVHVLMDFSITNNFKISCNYFGVSEMRLVLALFNIILIFFGKQILVDIFPFFVAGSFIALCMLVYKSQKVYRNLDTMHQGMQDNGVEITYRITEIKVEQTKPARPIVA